MSHFSTHVAQSANADTLLIGTAPKATSDAAVEMIHGSDNTLLPGTCDWVLANRPYARAYSTLNQSGTAFPICQDGGYRTPNMQTTLANHRLVCWWLAREIPHSMVILQIQHPDLHVSQSINNGGRRLCGHEHKVMFLLIRDRSSPNARQRHACGAQLNHAVPIRGVQQLVTAVQEIHSKDLCLRFEQFLRSVCCPLFQMSDLFNNACGWEGEWGGGSV